MLRENKEQIVAELTERLQATDTLIVADYRGLTMKEIDALRGELLQHNARFTVVKNSLTRRAAEAAGADIVLTLLDGPTAIAFLDSGADPVAVAKALADTARTTKVLAIRGGMLEGRVMSGAEVEELAKLPAADVLRGQVLGAIAAPLYAILGLFTAPLQDLHGLITARIEQLGGEEAAHPPIRDSGPVEGDPGEPGGSPAESEAPLAEEPDASQDTTEEQTEVEEPEAADEPAEAESEG
jgi:large subunit ribosomal protein L10